MKSKVRTRFAPSPTGYLHVGGLRTALFNFLFARHNGGQFILRIEDTDRSRYVPGATEKLIHSLKWAGLQYDEGPDCGGPHGPYMQSERLEIYRRHVDRLLQSGDAYYCFCSEEKLEAMRRKQVESGATPGYDGTCRSLSPEEVQGQLEAGVSHVVRLKMPREGETRFLDLIRGEVAVQNELVDDQVLLKSDGFPTYHLANVVDDHLMEISHVIRGEEWLLSVPKHLRLYQAFGWQPPQMAHLSLLLNPDRSKLSKRQGDVAVEDYMEKGYLPEALVNFVALLGWNPGTDQEIFSMAQLIEAFSLDRVNKAGAVFDVAKLNWMNGQYLRQLPEERLVDFLMPFLKKGGATVSDPAQAKKIILSVYKNLERGDQILNDAAAFFREEITVVDKEALALLKTEASQRVLTLFAEKLSAVPQLDMDTFRKIMKEIQQQSAIKGQELWKPVRVALTGEFSGPELPAVIEVFGREKVLRLVKQVLQRYCR